MRNISTMFNCTCKTSWVMWWFASTGKQCFGLWMGSADRSSLQWSLEQTCFRAEGSFLVSN